MSSSRDCNKSDANQLYRIQEPGKKALNYGRSYKDAVAGKESLCLEFDSSQWLTEDSRSGDWGGTGWLGHSADPNWCLTGKFGLISAAHLWQKNFKGRWSTVASAILTSLSFVFFSLSPSQFDCLFPLPVRLDTRPKPGARKSDLTYILKLDGRSKTNFFILFMVGYYWIFKV